MKVTSVVFDWYKFWVADKLIKYYEGEDEEDDDDFDCSELLMLIWYWLFHWGNIGSAIVFAVNHVEDAANQAQDLYATAVYSLAHSSVESIAKAFSDFYKYARQKLKQRDSGGWMTHNGVWSLWLGCLRRYKNFGDQCIKIYHTVIAPMYHKYVVLSKEFPQIGVTLYHLAQQKEQDL